MPLPARAAGAPAAGSSSAEISGSGLSDDGPRAYPGVLLSLAEAAWAAGLTREELTGLIGRGALPARRLVRGRRVVAAVALGDLERLVRERRTRDRSPARPLELRLARLEGELAASTRVERSLQAYADKLEARMDAAVSGLEQRLAESRKREMSLARLLGAAEARLEASLRGLREPEARAVEPASPGAAGRARARTEPGEPGFSCPGAPAGATPGPR